MPALASAATVNITTHVFRFWCPLSQADFEKENMVTWNHSPDVKHVEREKKSKLGLCHCISSVWINEAS